MDKNAQDVWLGKTTLTRLFFKSKETEKIYEFEEAYVNVTRQKNIVETVVQGRDGTVKEFISNNDFSLDIEVAYSVENDERYPRDEMVAFHNLLEEKREVGVGSDFLNIFGIVEVVIKGYSVPQQTFSNRQKISIQAVSDKPYLMRLKDNE